MEYKAEFAITLPEDLLDALGIDEDTLFEAYYDDGKIKVRILECPHFCWHCGVCTLDE